MHVNITFMFGAFKIFYMYMCPVKSLSYMDAVNKAAENYLNIKKKRIHAYAHLKKLVFTAIMFRCVNVASHLLFDLVKSSKSMYIKTYSLSPNQD